MFVYVVYLYSYSLILVSENVLKNTTDEASEFEEVSRCRADNIFSFPFVKAQVVIYLYYCVILLLLLLICPGDQPNCYKNH